MAIQLRDRPEEADAPDFRPMGVALAVAAVCLLCLGGVARLVFPGEDKRPRATASAPAKKPPQRAARAGADVIAGPAADAAGRPVRRIGIDMTPTSIHPAPAAAAPLPPAGAFPPPPRSANYQGFREVAGR